MDKLSDSKVHLFELKLEDEPSDIDSRLTLLRQYLCSRSETKLLARFKHILWMIDNAAEREETGSAYCFLDERYSEDHVTEFREHWLRQAADQPRNAAIQGNAGLSIHFHEFELGLSLLKEACMLAPTECMWPRWVSQLCWLRLAYSDNHTEDDILSGQVISFGERALEFDMSEHPALKFMTLSNMALCAINLGEYEKAKLFASKHDEIALSCEIESELQVGKAVRGLVALRTGQLNAAKNALLNLDYGYSPQLAAKKLARELVEAGETTSVLQFFELVHSVKSFPQLRSWIRSIKRGEVPADLGIGDG